MKVGAAHFNERVKQLINDWHGGKRKKGEKERMKAGLGPLWASS
jgi:hypothetical protein